MGDHSDIDHTGLTGVGGGGSGQGLVDFAHARRTSGDVTLTTNNTWMDVDTGIDLTVAASTGDVLEVGFSGYCGGSEAVTLYMDAHTIVSATPTNSIANGAAVSDSNDGVSAWRFPASTIHNSGGTVMYSVQAGDISGGNVTLRLRGKPASTTDRVLSASTARPLAWHVKNLGQPL